MATYIQLTFLPFWFKIVSIAIAVLPVWRSPIISSLWPLPIGIIASIALIPVCKGVSTDFLVITPGAILSTGLFFVDTIGPKPSIGWPRALTTLPSNPSPTGTSTTLPVLFTKSPSLMVWSEPSITAPTESSFKFKTMP